MQIEKSSENDVTTLKVSGEVDLHASPELRSELQSCVSEKTPVLLVDFSAVEYIDSSGLATFIEYLRDAAAYDGKIALFGMKQKVRTIFLTSSASTSSLRSPIRPIQLWPRSLPNRPP